MKKIIQTSAAPAAIGPYSQAVVANGFIYLSGQIPLDPETGEVLDGTVADQTHRVMQNLSAVLKEAGSSLAHAVKTTVYLADMNDFVQMNEVYGSYFDDMPPARATLQVARLPKDVSVEIDVVALA